MDSRWTRISPYLSILSLNDVPMPFEADAPLPCCKAQQPCDLLNARDNAHVAYNAIPERCERFPIGSAFMSSYRRID
jgi:hypothetical protein